MPNPVGDDEIKYMCFSCFAQIVFESCPACGFAQAIPSRWQVAFSCGKCGEKVAIPRMRLYSTSTKAVGVTGFGYTWPRM